MSKKELPKFDYEHKLEPDMLNFMIRLEDVESEERSVSNFMQMKELEWHSHVTELQRFHNFQNEQAKELRRKVDNAKNIFFSIISQLRSKATDDEYNKLKIKIERWDLERFVTKSEFKKMIRKKIK
jgi:hypothetical protein